LAWRFPMVGAATAMLILLSLFLFAGDPTLWLLFLVIPCVALLLFVLLVLLIFRRTRRFSAGLLLATLVFVGIMTAGWRFEATLRPRVRWAFLSRGFKRQVLAQPNGPHGDFKHVEWDGWGGVPIGDWTAYVVFDPTDSLKAESGREHPGMITGIPCDVLSVRRLEPYWYSVTLEMNEYWERCGKDASGAASE